MANQPPNRPWFRLPNIARQPPPPPPPPQAQPQPPSPPRQPRIPVIRTTFRPTFSQAQSAPPPPPPQPSAPQTQPPIVAPSSPTPTPTPTPTQPPSPNTPPPPFAITSPSPPAPRPSPPPIVASPPYVSPPRSPTPIKTTRSPPPISLPPTQLNSSKGESKGPRSMPEAEQEKVLLQETFNKKVVHPSSEGNSFKGHNKSSRHGRLKEADGRKLSSDSEDGKNVRIITMTGENKGALMELGFPSRRNIHGHKVGNGSAESENIRGGNADQSKVKDHNGMEMSPTLPMSGYVNNNVQGINNSILYSCSFTHHDPGVHFSVSRKPINGKGEGNGRGIHHKDLANGKKL